MRTKVISLFSGAGGLDFGFEAAGFQTVLALERDSMCCKTLRHNRSWPVLEADLLATPTAKILSAAGMRPGEPDAVIGGPPCQPFSKAGYWVNGDSERLDDPRAKTLGAFMRVVEETRPRVFLLENVEGLTFTDKDEGLRLLVRRIQAVNRKAGTNYVPVWKVINAADFGVPQVRERFFLVAARDGSQFKFPDPTHAERPEDGSATEPWRTAWDALGDEEPPPGEDLEVRGKWADLLPSIPEGHNYLYLTPEGGGTPLFGWRTRYWSFLLKLAKRRPSWTIPAHPGPAAGPFHWKSRRLSTRELCRLQTFPADVTVLGGRTGIQRQIGNAVPSLLAEVLARQIATQLFGLPQYKGAPRLLPERREPVPSRERVRPIQAQFLKYRGDHKRHPGTGRGPGAVLMRAAG